MKNIKNCILILFILFAYCSNAYAQSISLNASINKNRISVDEQLVLKVTVTGDVSNLPDPELPGLPGFTAYSSGRSQNISIVNGRVSSSLNYNYTLVPKAAGAHVIGSVILKYKNKIYKTNPITVQVVQAQQPVQPQSRKQQHPGQVQAPVERKKMFITTTVDKKKAYVGEQIILSFKFFRNIRLLTQPQYVPPDIIGFWAEDLPPQQQYYANVGSSRYLVTEIKTALFPTAAGKYTIYPAQLKCTVEDFSPGSSFNDDFFRNFFSSGKTQLLKTKPITITVLSLPSENKPHDFTGTVGDYSIIAKTDMSQVKVNEPVTLELTISGKGNIKSINEPDIGKIEGFKKYETFSSINISKQDYKVQGSKSFKTILVPQVTGKQVIPSISYSYFNPKSKIYKRIKSNSVTLKVLQGPKEEGIKILTSEGVKLIGTDIRYIKIGKINFTVKKKLLYKNPLFIAFQFIPVLGLLFGWGYKFRSEKLDSDIGYARATRAYRTARKKLKHIRKLIDTDKTKQYYNNLAAAFCEYMANKFNLSAAGLTLNILVEELSAHNTKTELINGIKDLWQEYDFARFAPSIHDNRKNKENIFNMTEDFITQLERSL